MEWQSRLGDYFCVCGVEPSNRDLSVDADATTPPRLLQHYPAQPRPDFAAAEFGYGERDTAELYATEVTETHTRTNA